MSDTETAQKTEQVEQKETEEQTPVKQEEEDVNEQQKETQEVKDAPGEQNTEKDEDTPDEMFETYKITNKLKPMSNQDIIKQQSIPVPGQEHVRMCPALNENEILGYFHEDARTVHEIFLRGIQQSNNGPCLGWRPNEDGEYTWLDHNQVLEHAQWIGSGIIEKGGKACQDQMIGIYSNNRVEWSIVDKACAGFSMVSVPLYDTLGEQAMVFIAKQCSIDYLFVDTNKKAAMLLNSQKKGDLCNLKTIILMEEISEDVTTFAKDVEVEVITYEALKKLGQENLHDFVPPKKDDLYTICYTSGTTGNPKGVMLTHSNMVANVAAATMYIMARVSDFEKEKHVLLSYLPLAHILERELHLVLHLFGYQIGFYGGNIRKVMDDALVLKPTVFPLVPRLMNKIYDKVWAMVNQSFLKKTVMNFAVDRKLAQLNKGKVSKNTIWDKLAFGKVQAMLGGNVKIAVTGAAPISVEVLNFMRCALGVAISEAYGTTETTAGNAATVAEDYEGGNVGSVLPTNFIKLVDVEDKNYFAKDGKGEICVKGTNVFKGYYKEEEKTKEVLIDGWYHTGDIGQWLPNGALKIIDRKKNIFKLSQGEYIAPEKIEQTCLLSSPVAQVFLHGESLKSTLVAVIVPDEDQLDNWCKQKGFQEKHEFKELCAHEKVNNLIFEDIQLVCKQGGLKSFEIPKKIHVSHLAFTIENNQMTPSLKSRRPQILAAYKTELDALYETLD